MYQVDGDAAHARVGDVHRQGHGGRRPRARRLGRAADAVARPREPVLGARRERQAEGRRRHRRRRQLRARLGQRRRREPDGPRVDRPPRVRAVRRPRGSRRRPGRDRRRTAPTSAPTTTAPRPPRPATAAYDPTKPIDLSGVEGVTPEQQAYAENLVAVNARPACRSGPTPPSPRPPASTRSATPSTGHEHYIQWDWIDDDVWLDPDAPGEPRLRAAAGRHEEAGVGDVHAARTTVALADVPDSGGPADAVARPRQPLLHRRPRGAAGRRPHDAPTARAGAPLVKHDPSADDPRVDHAARVRPVRRPRGRRRRRRSSRARSAGATTPTAREPAERPDRPTGSAGDWAACWAS